MYLIWRGRLIIALARLTFILSFLVLVDENAINHRYYLNAFHLARYIDLCIDRELNLGGYRGGILLYNYTTNAWQRFKLDTNSRVLFTESLPLIQMLSLYSCLQDYFWICLAYFSYSLDKIIVFKMGILILNFFNKKSTLYGYFYGNPKQIARLYCC